MVDKKLIIIGAGGHGKVVADIAVQCGYADIAFLDDYRHGSLCFGFPIVGKISDYHKFTHAKFIVAIGNPIIRRKTQEEIIASGMDIVSLVHPKSCISRSVVIGLGTVVMAGAVINPDSVIGDGCIINTCSSVDHDCIIKDLSHISVGAHIAGSVTIGQNVMIGAGATVINNIHMCNDCTIGAGAVVVNNIEEGGTYVGVPVRLINSSA